MKGFNPIKTMQKFIVIIIILTLICSTAVCYLLNKKQSYSASMLIEYTGTKAAKSLNPDDTVIDISEIYSATVIDNVIKDLNLDCSVEAIRGSVVVQPVIPLTETKRETAAIELNSEYEFIPTKFLVTYTADSNYSEEYAREVLDCILTHYYTLYSQKYVVNVAHPNNSLHISVDNYDYLECVELLTNNINSLATYCMARDQSFYSARSGYSFSDLQLELEYLRDNYLYDLNVYILENMLTRDRDLLLQKERNKVAQYEIKMANIDKLLGQQIQIIEQFAEKTLDGQLDMSGMDNIGIISAVEGSEEFRKSIATTYDILINQYAQLLLEDNYYASELQQAEEIIAIYSSDNFGKSNSRNSDLATERLKDILDRFNELYDSLLLVVKDYYNVRSAAYLSFNSNLQSSENVNLKLYLVVAMFMFFVVWSCFFIAADRIKDIIISIREKNNQGQSEGD